MNEFEWEDQPAPTRHRADGIAVATALAVLALLVTVVLTGVNQLRLGLEGGVESIGDPFSGATDRPATVVRTDDDGTSVRAPVTFLVLGSDSRTSGGNAEEWQFGAQRTDAIMIVQLAGDRESVTVMSIPRDSWVDVPGYGMNKINAAFSFGGAPLMVRTVEQLTGIRLDHVVVADFRSFAALTDQLGGVELTLTQPLEVDGHETLQPGTHVLDGEQALAYTRERYNVAGGDFGRVQRQQSWLRAIVVGAFEDGVLDDPAYTMGLIGTLLSSVAVDDDLSTTRLLGLSIGARGLHEGDFRFITAPYAGTGWSPDGRQSIVELDQPLFEEVCAAFAEDRISDYLAENADGVPRLGEEVD